MKHIAILLTEAEHKRVLDLLKAADKSQRLLHNTAPDKFPEEDKEVTSIIQKFSVRLESKLEIFNNDEEQTATGLFPLELEELLDVKEVNEVCDGKLEVVLGDLGYTPVALTAEVFGKTFVTFGTLWLLAAGSIE